MRLSRSRKPCYNFSQMTLLRGLAFLLGSQTVILTVLLFWIYLFLLILVFVLQWFSLNLIMLLSQFPLTFHQILHRLNVLSSSLHKGKLFAAIFFMNSNLDDSGISLPVFRSTTNLKLHNISPNPKMVKKVITNLDLSKASSPDCIPVVVLKICEPERS